MKKISFKKGFAQVRQVDAPDVKKKIMAALGINTRAAWWKRLNGLVEPRVSEAAAIESIFAEYGITDIWGDASYEPTSKINQ